MMLNVKVNHHEIVVSSWLHHKCNVNKCLGCHTQRLKLKVQFSYMLFQQINMESTRSLSNKWTKIKKTFLQ